VHKVTLTGENSMRLQEHMMIFFTGLSRTASEVAAHQMANIPRRAQELSAMQAMVGEGLKRLNTADLKGFGKLLDESWKLKRSLSDRISTPDIDDMYARAMQAGALGGKLLGAGGGGFVLIYAEPDKKQAVRKALSKFLEIPFKFETLGSQIIFYQPNSGVVA
jgi:D-glycero-alpha-D-manno-heptose-7-phosphate kinase